MIRTLLCAASIAALGGAANAATLVSLDRAAFQAAIAGGNTTTEDFNSYKAGTAPTTPGVVYEPSSGGLAVWEFYPATTPQKSLGKVGTLDSSDNVISFFQADETLMITFADPITVFGIDINSFAEDDGAYKVELDTGVTVTSLFARFPGFDTGQFLGFVTATPFTTLTFSAVERDPKKGAFTLDTMVFSRAPSPIPLPAGLPLILSALAVLAVLRHAGRRAV